MKSLIYCSYCCYKWSCLNNEYYDLKIMVIIMVIFIANYSLVATVEEEEEENKVFDRSKTVKNHSDSLARPLTSDLWSVRS